MNCVGIGKIIYDNIDSEWNFPHLHFVVFNEEQESGIYAFCMELGVEGHGKNSTSAIKDLIYSCNAVISKLLNTNYLKLFEHLKAQATGNHSEQLWEQYRLTEIDLAAQAKDLGNAIIQDMKREINGLLKKNENLDLYIKELQSLNLNNEAA